MEGGGCVCFSLSCICSSLMYGNCPIYLKSSMMGGIKTVLLCGYGHTVSPTCYNNMDEIVRFTKQPEDLKRNSDVRGPEISLIFIAFDKYVTSVQT